MIKRVADARMGLNWDAAAVKEAESASAQTRKESTRYNLNVLFPATSVSLMEFVECVPFPG